MSRVRWPVRLRCRGRSFLGLCLLLAVTLNPGADISALGGEPQPGPAAGSHRPTALDWLLRGQQLLEHHKAEEAAQAFTLGSVAADGRCDGCVLGVASALLDSHSQTTPVTSMDDALEVLRTALRTDPESPLANPARVTLCLVRQSVAPIVAAFPPMGSAAGAAPDLQIHRVEGEVSAPRKLYAPPPFYTEEARRNKTQGTVIVESILDEDGCVANAHFLKHLDPGLDRAALGAVRHWVFRPAQRSGKPVKVFYTLTINFRADEPATDRGPG
jgi:TonB family protein